MRNTDWFIRYLGLGLCGPLLFLNVWLMGQMFNFFEQVITISVLSAILALLLNYPVLWLTQLKIKRHWAIFIVAALAITLLVLLALAVVPLVINQAIELLEAIPRWFSDSSDQIRMLDEMARSRRWPINFSQVTDQLQGLIQALLEWLPELAIGTLGRIFDAVIMFVMTFYMLLYGAPMWDGIMNLLPKPYGRAVSSAIRYNFQQFFISQLILAVFMLIVLTIAFLIIKVRFALLLALLIAIFELIPFIGATIGISLVVLLVLLQNPWLALQTAIAAIILQQIKDNILAPKLFGSFIGLNPIWVFIALLIGGRVAGLLGILLSVPIAGTVKACIDKIQRTQRVLAVLQGSSDFST